MARIEWVEQRLQNWARWKAIRGGSGSMGYAAVSLADADAGRDGYITASVPMIDVEASETDDAVQRLWPGGLHLAVLEVYLGRGGMRDKALRMCCTEQALHARITRAHFMLAEHFNAKAQRAKAERQRVEALQRSVQP